MSNVLEPSPARKSQYAIDPAKLGMRASELPGIVGVRMKELFPEMPDAVYPGCDIKDIRQMALNAIKNIDLSRVKPGDSVNICASHHGFTLLGGAPYAEVLKAVRDMVIERTGTTDVRLRTGNGLRFRECEEYIARFGLDEYFQHKCKNVAPIDRAVPIETEIGTLYGIAEIYDADWIIHVHNSDIREVHYHRLIDRIMKPFGMSYARIETRSAYHLSLGPRGANFVARAIYQSPFVQKKFLGAVILEVCPVGLTNIDADNDLVALNERITANALMQFGKLLRLLNRVEDCVVIVDCPGPVVYTFAAGLVLGNFLQANVDLFDLRMPSAPYSYEGEMAYNSKGKMIYPGFDGVNRNIKAIIINYSFKGYPAGFVAQQYPTILVGDAITELFTYDELSVELNANVVTARDLKTALTFAGKIANTDNLIIFDGAIGGINMSEPVRDSMFAHAAEVRDEVENKLMPMWLEQRGITAK